MYRVGTPWTITDGMNVVPVVSQETVNDHALDLNLFALPSPRLDYVVRYEPPPNRVLGLTGLPAIGFTMPIV
jgi:hypothetical protein